MSTRRIVRLRDLNLKLIVLIFLAVFCFNFVDQFTTSQIEKGLRSQQGIDSVVWLWVAASLISSFLFPLFIALLCSFTLARAYLPVSSFDGFLEKKFELSLVETLRAWGKSFLWSFLFIIPGLIKFTYYFLTPYIVFFSNRYAQGEVDALDYSEQVTKTFWWRFNGWLFLFYGVIPLFTALIFDEYKSFFLHPLSALVFSMTETVFIILFHYFILNLFINSLKSFEPTTDKLTHNPTKESHVFTI